MNCYKADITFEMPLPMDKNEYGKSVSANIISGLQAYNSEHLGNSCVFVCRAEEKKISFAVIINGTGNAEDIVNEAAKRTRISGQVNIIEITVGKLNELLPGWRRGNQFDFDSDLIEPYKISEFCRIDYACEKLAKEYDYEDHIKSAKLGMYDKEFVAEIGRIRQGSAIAKIKGTPVHYIIRSDQAEDICDRLVSVLHEHGRISSRRYCILNDEIRGEEKGELIFNTVRDCTLVVDLNGYTGQSGEYAVHDMLNEEFCKLVRANCRNTQIIFMLTNRQDKLVKRIKELYPGLTFIEIDEHIAMNDEAKELLSEYCREDEIEADEDLLNNIAADTGYTVSDLRQFYENWYISILKTRAYPQYSEFARARKSESLEPMGNASQKLDEMPGLEPVKKVIKQAVAYSKVQKALAHRGMPVAKRSMHMVFTGNPGTAKTTVARLFAQILKDNEVLSVGDLIECGRSDLVGKYVGWTADQVKKKFEEAEGSVMFIDEAYSLLDDKRGLFGDEAINTIVQEMENNRGDMVVIFAGYPNEMKEFIERNPGLRSRISFYVNFDNYNTDELCEISKLIAKDNGYNLADDVSDVLRPIFDKAVLSEDFGNGRFARNLVEQAQLAQAMRLSECDPDKLSGDDLATLRAEDFSEINTEIKDTKGRRTIGF